MAHLERGNARIYYDREGRGPPLLTLHGLTENTAYWRLPGVTARLAARYHVISMDLRGHGGTHVEGEPYGFDVETVIEDIGALADALDLTRFHILSHSTGGMAAVRYAMRHSDRLASLVLTDTSSNTAIFGLDLEQARLVRETLAAAFDGKSWDEIVPAFRQLQAGLLAGLNAQPDPDSLWKLTEQMFRLGDPDTLARFIRSFYVDPDPQLEGLRRIDCPTLVLCGEHDEMFLPPSQVLAREIPDAKLVVLPGIGHMTAIEAPEETSTEILEFLDAVEEESA